jgi:hypothetical protein
MGKLLRIVALSAGAASLAACIPAVNQLQFESAGQTGCQPDAITIANQKPADTGYMWNATCGGKTYLCTGLVSCSGTGCVPSTTQVSCAPAVR